MIACFDACDIFLIKYDHHVGALNNSGYSSMGAQHITCSQAHRSARSLEDNEHSQRWRGITHDSVPHTPHHHYLTYYHTLMHNQMHNTMMHHTLTHSVMMLTPVSTIMQHAHLCKHWCHGTSWWHIPWGMIHMPMPNPYATITSWSASWLKSHILMHHEYTMCTWIALLCCTLFSQNHSCYQGCMVQVITRPSCLQLHLFAKLCCFDHCNNAIALVYIHFVPQPAFRSFRSTNVTSLTIHYIILIYL